MKTPGFCFFFASSFASSLQYLALSSFLMLPRTGREHWIGSWIAVGKASWEESVYFRVLATLVPSLWQPSSAGSSQSPFSDLAFHALSPLSQLFSLLCRMWTLEWPTMSRFLFLKLHSDIFYFDIWTPLSFKDFSGKHSLFCGVILRTPCSLSIKLSLMDLPGPLCILPD